MNIFVAKLDPELSSEDLEDLFSPFGSVSTAKVIMDRDTGRSKCFGFVEMDDDEEAQKAIDELNDTDINGKRMVVKKAEPRGQGGGSRGGGGGYGGGRGGGGYGGGRGGGGYGGGGGGGYGGGGGRGGGGYGGGGGRY